MRLALVFCAERPKTFNYLHFALRLVCPSHTLWITFLAADPLLVYFAEGIDAI
jgi:hypothetical protein